MVYFIMHWSRVITLGNGLIMEEKYLQLIDDIIVNRPLGGVRVGIHYSVFIL